MAISASSTGTGGGFLNSLVGGTGAMGQAANQTWQAGQFMPYNLSLPGANLNFQNNTATGSLNGGLGSMYSGMGNFGSGILGSGMLNYNPTAGSYLGGQYNSIYGTNPSTAGNINSAANGQFQNLMNAEQPWLQQQQSSNLDSEMAKGTLASTAGQYQTAGFNQAYNSLMSQNANTAYQQALQQAGLQQSEQQSAMGAASNVANMQEQESQFAPTLGTSQLNSAFGNLNSTNNATAQQIGLGANIGGMRSQANTNALQNNFTAGMAGLQGQSGFLNSLLFGGGQGGGLLSGILGGTGGGSGVLGSLGSMAANGVGSLFNSLFGSNNSGSNLYSGGLGTIPNLNYNGTSGGTDFSNLGDLSGLGGFGTDNTISGTSDFNNMNSGFNSSDYGNLGFNGAGGQAASSDLSSNPNIGQDISTGFGAGQNALGLYSGLQQGGVMGDTSAALNANAIANKLGYGNSTLNAGASYLGPLMNIYGGIQQGGVLGNTQAGVGAAELADQAGTAAGSSTAASAAPIIGGLATGIGALGAWYGASQYLASKGNNLDEYTSQKDYAEMKQSLMSGPGTTPQSTMDYYNAQSQLGAQYLQTGGSNMPYTQSQLDAWGIPQMAQAYMMVGSPGVSSGQGPGSHNDSRRQL